MLNSENILLPKKYRVLSIEKHTEVEWNFRIECDFDVKFGQFVEVSLPLYGEAPISISDYGEGYIDLLIRKVGKVTGGLFELSEGDYVWMRGVHGNGYPLDEYKGKHLIVIAGGTGTAPVKGLMNSFCENPDQVKHLDMILGFKNTDSVLYKDQLQKWSKAQNLIVTLDEGEADNFYKTGRVTDYIADLDLSDKEDIQLIVVGPPIMIKFVVEEFLSKGLKKDQIWVDYERKMACAVGKCGHCRIGSTYICLDGPIFRFDKAQHLID